MRIISHNEVRYAGIILKNFRVKHDPAQVVDIIRTCGSPPTCPKYFQGWVERVVRNLEKTNGTLC